MPRTYMSTEKQTIEKNPLIEAMFKVGAHLGYSKSRRHPSTSPYIFGAKNRVEIIDLEKTAELLEKAKNYVRMVASERGQILFVSGKKEAERSIRKAAEALLMPHVPGRWIGGTFTNFSEIRKRIERLEDLTRKREKGELGQYTKKERLLIDREIITLDALFGGLIPMKQIPKALFVIDSRKEDIAVTEARKLNVPVIALAGSDCNIKDIEYPIVANDASVHSIEYFLDEIVAAYKEGLLKAAPKVEAPIKARGRI